MAKSVCKVCAVLVALAIALVAIVAADLLPPAPKPEPEDTNIGCMPSLSKWLKGLFHKKDGGNHHDHHHHHNHHLFHHDTKPYELPEPIAAQSHWTHDHWQMARKIDDLVLHDDDLHMKIISQTMRPDRIEYNNKHGGGGSGGSQLARIINMARVQRLEEEYRAMEEDRRYGVRGGPIEGSEPQHSFGRALLEQLGLWEPKEQDGAPPNAQALLVLAQQIDAISKA